MSMKRIVLFFSVIHDGEKIWVRIRTAALCTNYLYRQSILVICSFFDMESIDPKKLEEILLKTKPKYSKFPVATTIPKRESLLWLYDTPPKYYCSFFH